MTARSRSACQVSRCYQSIVIMRNIMLLQNLVVLRNLLVMMRTICRIYIRVHCQNLLTYDVFSPLMFITNAHYTGLLYTCVLSVLVSGVNDVLMQVVSYAQRSRFSSVNGTYVHVWMARNVLKCIKTTYIYLN